MSEDARKDHSFGKETAGWAGGEGRGWQMKAEKHRRLSWERARVLLPTSPAEFSVPIFSSLGECYLAYTSQSEGLEVRSKDLEERESADFAILWSSPTELSMDCMTS